jgi:hypothetical protein
MNRSISSFTKGNAAIGFDFTGNGGVTVATAFCNPRDHFSRDEARKRVTKRLDFAIESGELRKNIFKIKSPVIEVLAPETAAHKLLDAFNEALTEGNDIYLAARAARQFPLPSRANTVRTIFVAKAALIREEQTV